MKQPEEKGTPDFIEQQDHLSRKRASISQDDVNTIKNIISSHTIEPSKSDHKPKEEHQERSHLNANNSDKHKLYPSKIKQPVEALTDQERNVAEDPVKSRPRFSHSKEQGAEVPVKALAEEAQLLVKPESQPAGHHSIKKETNQNQNPTKTSQPVSDPKDSTSVQSGPAQVKGENNSLSEKQSPSASKNKNADPSRSPIKESQPKSQQPTNKGSAQPKPQSQDKNSINKPK